MIFLFFIIRLILRRANVLRRIAFDQR